MKYGKFALIALLVIGMLGLLATTGLAATQKKPGDYKMVLILPGPINDQSWNATNYAGLQAANKALGTNITYVENVQPSDFVSTFQNYGQRGYDLVLAAGTQFDDAAKQVAPNYPNTTFCVINGQVAQAPNLCPVLPKEYEGSFLAGVIAGYTTKTGTIGIGGGFPNKLMIRLLNTYEYGARIGDPTVKTIRAYANSWTNVALGKQMASSMIQKGADTIFFYANQVGLGAIQACKEQGAKFIGFASDQNSVAPGTVVASVSEDFGALYKYVVNKFMAGQLKPVVNEVGIAQGFFKIDYSNQVSQHVRDLVKQASEDIANGTLLKFISQFPQPLQ
jgi:basic membrane protein A and related proteins